MSDELLVPLDAPLLELDMNQTQSVTPQKKSIGFWIGVVLTVLMSALLMMSASMKLTQPESFVKEFTEKLGYPLSSAMPIGIVELICALLYLFPRTNILGAILLTGYMGGAIATHVRINDPFVAQVIIALVIWLGPFLREPKLRQILFWRS